MSASNLASWNHLPAMAQLKSGQTLVMYVPSVPARAQAKGGHSKPKAGNKSGTAQRSSPSRPVASKAPSAKR